MLASPRRSCSARASRRCSTASSSRATWASTSVRRCSGSGLLLAPNDSFRLILEVDEADIAAIRPRAGRRAGSAAEPGRALAFRTRRIVPVAATADGRNDFEVEAALEDTLPQLRPGLSGVAKVQAGWRPLGWLLGHRAFDWLRLAWWKVSPWRARPSSARALAPGGGAQAQPGCRPMVRSRCANRSGTNDVEPGSGRQLRLNPAAHALVARFDGSVTWALCSGSSRSCARKCRPRTKCCGLLVAALQAWCADAAPHLSLLFARRAEEHQRRRRGMLNPLSMRMPLADPSRLLQALAPAARAVPLRKPRCGALPCCLRCWRPARTTPSCATTRCACWTACPPGCWPGSPIRCQAAA